MRSSEKNQKNTHSDRGTWSLESRGRRSFYADVYDIISRIY